MSSIELSVPSGVMVKDLAKHADAFAALYKEIGRSLAGPDDEAPELRMTGHRQGSLVLETRPELAESGDSLTAENAVQALILGLESLANEGEPLGFTNRALRYADSLVGQFGSDDAAVVVTSGDRSVRCDSRVRQGARRILNRKSATWGTVEGRVESVSIHNRHRFNLYELLSGEKVECRFGSNLLDLVRQSLGNRVLVVGTINKRGDEIDFVSVESIQARPDPANLPSFADIWGMFSE